MVTMALSLLQLAYQLLAAAQGYNVPEWQRQQAISTANNAIAYAQTVIQNQGGFQPIYQPSYGTAQIILAGDGIENSLRKEQYYQIVWTPSNPSLGAVDIELLNYSTNSVVAFIGRSYTNSIGWLPNVASGNYWLRATQNGTVISTRAVTVL